MASAHGDTGLDNDSLAPLPKSERTWGWFEIFNIWANDIQSLFGYSLVASLFIAYGVTGWTAFAALITASILVMVLVNISGKPGVDYGIPYPVVARASMGVGGARLPAILRSIVAVFWYGAQTYFASTALELLIVTLTGATGGQTWLGLSAIGWLSFVVVWAFQIVIFSRGMNWIGTFLNVAGPFVYLVMIGLLIVLWQQSDGKLWSAAQTIFAPANPTFSTEFKGFIAIVGTMVAYFAAVMINFSDFSRYSKSNRSMVIGNLAGLPANMVLFSALALLITAGAAVIYGEKITNPTDIVARADSALLSVIAAITFFAATVGINLVANFIPAVNGIANLAPRVLTFKRAGWITSLFALVIGGAWVSFISVVGIAGFVNTLGATLAPLYGIMVVDYYLLRKQRLIVKDLYSTDPSGAYAYNAGWNRKALIAFAVAGAFSIATVWVDALESLSGYAWLLGALFGAVMFAVLTRGDSVGALQARRKPLDPNDPASSIWRRSKVRASEYGSLGPRTGLQAPLERCWEVGAPVHRASCERPVCDCFGKPEAACHDRRLMAAGASTRGRRDAALRCWRPPAKFRSQRFVPEVGIQRDEP